MNIRGLSSNFQDPFQYAQKQKALEKKQQQFMENINKLAHQMKRKEKPQYLKPKQIKKQKKALLSRLSSIIVPKKKKQVQIFKIVEAKDDQYKKLIDQVKNNQINAQQLSNKIIQRQGKGGLFNGVFKIISGCGIAIQIMERLANYKFLKVLLSTGFTSQQIWGGSYSKVADIFSYLSNIVGVQNLHALQQLIRKTLLTSFQLPYLEDSSGIGGTVHSGLTTIYNSIVQLIGGLTFDINLWLFKIVLPIIAIWLFAYLSLGLIPKIINMALHPVRTWGIIKTTLVSQYKYLTQKTPEQIMQIQKQIEILQNRRAAQYSKNLMLHQQNTAKVMESLASKKGFYFQSSKQAPILTDEQIFKFQLNQQTKKMETLAWIKRFDKYPKPFSEYLNIFINEQNNVEQYQLAVLIMMQVHTSFLFESSYELTQWLRNNVKNRYKFANRYDLQIATTQTFSDLTKYLQLQYLIYFQTNDIFMGNDTPSEAMKKFQIEQFQIKPRYNRMYVWGAQFCIIPSISFPLQKIFYVKYQKHNIQFVIQLQGQYLTRRIKKARIMYGNQSSDLSQPDNVGQYVQIAKKVLKYQMKYVKKKYKLSQKVSSKDPSTQNTQIQQDNNQIELQNPQVQIQNDQPQIQNESQVQKEPQVQNEPQIQNQ